MQGRAKRPVTRRQISAGGIVYRRVEGAIEVALVRVRRGRVERWVLPKGLVAEGATLAAYASDRRLLQEVEARLGAQPSGGGVIQRGERVSPRWPGAECRGQ